MAAPLFDRANVELLAPAGNWECARAAVENGANAIYFGLDCGFNARARAANFAAEDLPELMAFLHRRNVRGYVTLNTLTFPAELPSLETLTRQIAASGVDAVLVQDLGAARLIRAICPDLPLHASTQMTLTSAPCIEAAKDLGIERVVLPRELSVREIAKIHQETTMPLEAFVHGALCVAYSGQCLTSESLGGRSANRGQCAQACRLPYELVCDGKDVELGNVKYLLSPQDLAALELVADMLAAGVVSFKIEGRLKTAEYVANITRHYRQAIDSALEGKPVEFTPTHIQEMELSFSRGFSPGWLNGCDHKMLVPGLSSAKRGVFLGQVVDIADERVQVRLATPVSRGDGVVFEGDRDNDGEQGGRVFQIFQANDSQLKTASSGVVTLAFQNDAVDFKRLWKGQQIWKTDDPKLSARLRKTYTQADPQRRVPLDLKVHAQVGKPLTITGHAESGASCFVQSADSLEKARKHPLTADVLRQQLGRLGGTVFQLRDLSAEITDQPMVPLSVLGKLRRDIVDQLNVSPMPPARRISTNSALVSLKAALPAVDTAVVAGPPELHVMCRTLEQLQATLELEVAEVIVDLQDIRQFREAVALAHEKNTKIFLATPRIQKPDELGIFRAMMRHGADGILVRNLSGLAFFHDQGIATVADFSLNASNELTVQYLVEKGARRVTASYDLNREQLLDLADVVPPAWLEVVIHQHMPMFHMEHCVFCSLLSPGTNKTNCGRPCDVHEVRMRDRIGMEHPLKADVGCRNTLFNAVPQSSAEVVGSLLDRGITSYRIELLDNSAGEVRTIIELYRQLLARRVSGKEVWRQLNASNRVGVTRGTLDESRNPLAIL